MENAAKALLIAGTVLISIIMVSIAVYLYALYSNQTKEYSETISAVELEKFNSKFDVYVGRDDISAQEIVTVVNLAREYTGIQIYLGTGEITDTSEEFIKTYQDKSFSCILSTSTSKPNPKYDDNGKIIKLTFKEN